MTLDLAGEEPLGVDIAADGRIAVARVRRYSVNLDVYDGQGERLRRPDWAPMYIRSVAFTKDQLWVLSGDIRMTLVRDGLEIVSFEVDDTLKPLHLAASDAGVVAAWSATGAWIRARLPKKVKGRKNVESRYSLQSHGRGAEVAVARQAGTVAISGLEDGQVVLLNPVTRDILTRFAIPSEGVTHLHLSPDGRWLQAAHDTRYWSVAWDTRSGEPVAPESLPAVEQTVFDLGKRLRRVRSRGHRIAAWSIRGGPLEVHDAGG